VTNTSAEYWYKVRAVKNGVDGPLSSIAHGTLKILVVHIASQHIGF